MFNWSLTDTSGFTDKASCGIGWTQELLWAYALANGVAFVLYFIFPFLVMIRLIPRHLPDVRPSLYALCLFIATCGLTHLAELWTVAWPAYRLTTAIHVLNAATSIAGFIWLLIALSRIKSIPMRTELEEKIIELSNKVKAVREKANRDMDLEGKKVALTTLDKAINALEATF